MIDSITLVLTEACNMRCKYCFEQKNNYKEKYMSIDTLEKTIYLFLNQENDDLNINLFGGEPTLNNVCIEKVIEILNKTNKKVTIDITTNLFYLNKKTFEKLDRLAKKENIYINVGISMILNEKYNDVDRIDVLGKGTYKKIVSNLEYCLNNFYNIDFHIHTVISKENIKYISEIIDSSIEFKLNHNRITRNTFALVSVASLSDGIDEYSKEELKYYYEDYIKRDRSKYDLDINYIGDMYFPISYSFDLIYNRELMVCRAMKTELTIGTDGDISPCHRADMGTKNNFVKKLSFGNILNINSFKEIEDKIPIIENIEDENVKFFSELNNEDCTKCNFNNLCHTCIIANYNMIGNFNYKSKGECLRTMTMAELTMEYERIKLMKEIKKELSEMKVKIDNLGEITTINTEALVELLKK